jgi:hypothetical protein
MFPFRSVPYFFFTLFTLLAPVFISGNQASETNPFGSVESPSLHRDDLYPAATTSAAAEALSLYHAMRLKEAGLSESAFLFAWKGYKKLLDEGRIQKREVLSICDYSQSSRRKRLYIIDVGSQRLLLQTFVAHGRNSGGEYAQSFSNRPESYKSSLGFFITRNTYFGTHGIALNLDGLEKGINDRADDRKIVVHGSRYVGASYLRYNPFIGRSLGCPAVPAKESQAIIRMIKNGSCFFIYHPTKKYIDRSALINS